MWVVAPPQRPTAAILYSNPLCCPCTLSGDLHGAIQVIKNRLMKTDFLAVIINKQRKRRSTMLQIEYTFLLPVIQFARNISKTDKYFSIKLQQNDCYMPIMCMLQFQTKI